jgi:hypothetical protein
MLERKAVNGLFVGIGAVLMMASGCESACKDIAHTALEPQCQTLQQFDAIHFDSALQFEVFLAERCEAPKEAQSEILAQVDFSQEAVLCASGPFNDPEAGCLREREVASVASCHDGVQFIYEDLSKENAEFCTTNLWFLCERLSRDEVRSAWAEPL